jgi:hypothetical protein
MANTLESSRSGDTPVFEMPIVILEMGREIPAPAARFVAAVGYIGHGVIQGSRLILLPNSVSGVKNA